MPLSARDRVLLANAGFWRRYRAQWGWLRGRLRGDGEEASNGWRKLAQLRRDKEPGDADAGDS
jgi:hypothetical protein